MVFGGNPKSPYTDMIQFYSKESPDQTLRPYLELNYTASGTGDGGSGQRIVYLTLRSTHLGGSVFVNGTQHEFPKSLEVVLDVPTGLYTIAASANFSTTERVKAVFQKWSDGSGDNSRQVLVEKDTTLEAVYVEYYYVEATTQYGWTGGTGWYRTGQSATVKVLGDPGTRPPRVKAEGILGLLGASYVFDHWSGYPTAASSLRLVANGPRVATAIWRQDYGLVYVNLMRAVLSLGAGIAAVIAVRGKILLKAQRTGKREARVSPLDFRTLFPRRSFSSANPGKSDPPGQTQANKNPRGTANPLRAARVPALATQTARPEPPPILCTSCEAQNASTNKFCEKCGQNLLRSS
jgi:hypothetical protein